MWEVYDGTERRVFQLIDLAPKEKCLSQQLPTEGTLRVAEGEAENEFGKKMKKVGEISGVALYE